MNDIPREELLSAYLDGELNADEQARAEELLASSAESRQLLEELRALRANLQSLPSHTLSGDFSQGVLEQAERAMLLGSAAHSRTGSPAAHDAPQHETATPGGRWLRPLVWAGMAIAAALFVMMMFPEEPREADETIVAVAPERDEQPPRDARPAPSMQAAPSAEPAAPLAKGGRDEAAPLAAPEAAPTDEMQMRPRGEDEDVLIVQLDVRPETAREGAFQRLLARQQIPLQQPDYVMSGEAPPQASESDVASDVPAEAELVYVEATPAQLEATLAELNQQRDVFLSVSVKAAPDAPLQTRWSEEYSRAQPARLGLPDNAQPAEPAPATVDARRHGRAAEQAAPGMELRMQEQTDGDAPSLAGQDAAVQSQLRRFVETQPLAPGQGSRAQKVVLPPSVQRELVQGQPPSLGRTMATQQRGDYETKPAAGMSRAVFVLRVVEPEPVETDAAPAEAAESEPQ